MSNTIQLSPDQRRAFDALQAWQEAGTTNPFYLAGLAGTGKTTIINEWAKLHSEAAYCAYTGKAAHVLRTKGVADASTIHRLMYNCFPDGTDAKGRKQFRWERKETLPHELIIVDEASMVPAGLRDDLEAYHIPVCYVGDHGQLPPVGSGETSNRLEQADIKLETIHRQAQGNPIIQWAHLARKGELPPYGSHNTVHRVRPSQLHHVIPITLEHGKVLVPTNRQRHEINQELRRLRFPTIKRGSGLFNWPNEPIRTGDILIGLKNNPQSGIFNGMLGEVLEAEDTDGGETRIALDVGYDEPVTAWICTGSLGDACHHREHDHLDYGYCLTVHKAQGSEWDAVVLVNGRYHYEMTSEDYSRWLYTGMTRASQELMIVG